MNLLVGLVTGALLAGLAVFVVMSRGRRGLQERVSAAQSAQAVAESRLQGLQSDHAVLKESERRLGEEKLRLAAERERLSTSLETTAKALEQERTTVAGLRTGLEESTATVNRLEADQRVLTQQGEALAADAADLRERLKKTETANRELTTRVAQLGADVSALETERRGLIDRLQKQEQWVQEQSHALEERIKNITGQLLEEKSQKFTEVNRKEIDAVVTPFKEQLREFRERVDHIYTADVRDRSQLVEQVAQLARLNQAVSQKAEELTKALTISTKSTGDWGEMILEKILEDSGLREGQEYTLQHTVTAAAEAALQRPDAVVFLPEKRQVVIDSKVSNKAWTEYCAASEDETREARLQDHLNSLRAHIRGLSARDYPSSPDLQTVDFVLMFVPVEAALLTALAHDGSLYTDAYRSKIILVTPSTLMAVLKLIEGMWAFQKRKESAEKIAEAGRKLYDKLTVFANTFEEVGAAIERAHGTFEKARGQLATGKGNAIRLAENMKRLGVTPGAGKAMPAQLVELAGDGEEEDDAEPPALPGRDEGADEPGTAAL